MSRRRARERRRDAGHSELMLAAMVDMMVNLLIFLLHLYGNDPVEISRSDALVLPKSVSRDPIERAPLVVVSQEAIEAGGQPLVHLVRVDGAPSLPEDALVDGRLAGLQRWLEEQLARTPVDPAAPRTPPYVVVEVDRSVPWSVVRAVVGTAGGAGYAGYRFVVRTAPSDEAQ